MVYSLWDRIRDWGLLVLFLILSVVVMLTRNEPIVRSLRATALQGTAQVEAVFSWAADYLRALDENQALRAANISLSSRLALLREAEIENDRLRAMLAFRDSSSFDLLPAQIISRDVTEQQNTLTLDVGENDSVKVGMPVIDERGILGKVTLTTKHYALVQPYLNTDFKVPAKIQPMQAHGIVRWEGNDRTRLRMDFVAKTEPVVKGQLIVTSEDSGIFPPGIPIGRVDSVGVNPGQNSLLIYLTPTAPIGNAEHAFVVRMNPPEHVVELEELARTARQDAARRR